MPAKVLESGVAAVPGGVLLGFLSNARGKNVSAALVGELFKIETERASASIKTIPHDDFPILPQVSAERSFTVKSGDLTRAIRSVAYCASTSAIKPEQQSVLMFGEAGKVTTAATDSSDWPKRASRSAPEAVCRNCLLPARNAAELMRIVETANS